MVDLCSRSWSKEGFSLLGMAGGGWDWEVEVTGLRSPFPFPSLLSPIP